MSAYLEFLTVLVSVWCVLALAYDMSAGRTGLFSLCQGACFGCGLYAMALAGKWGIGMAVVAGGGASALLSAVVAASSVRLRGDDFVIATYGLQLAFTTLVTNLTGLTGGAGGHAVLVGDSGRWQALVLSLALMGGVVALSQRLWGTAHDRLLRAINDDETLAATAGKPVFAKKVEVFVMSGVISAVAGAVYALHLGHVTPDICGLNPSVLALAMYVVGANRVSWGVIAGAVGLVLLPEALRLLELRTPDAGNVRQMMYGTVLVVAILIRIKRGQTQGTHRIQDA